MKIPKKVHLYILTTLVVISAGAIPAALLGFFFSFDITVRWFNNDVPLNILVFMWMIFIASFKRQLIYEKLDKFIFGESTEKSN
jgi:hypothetical protein